MSRFPQQRTMGVQPHGREQSGKRCLAALKNALGTFSCSPRDSRSGPCARHWPWGAAAGQRFTEPPRPAAARIQHRIPRGHAGPQLPVGDSTSQTLRLQHLVVKVPRRGSTWMGLPSCEKGLPGGVPWPSTALRAAAPSLGKQTLGSLRLSGKDTVTEIGRASCRERVSSPV